MTAKFRLVLSQYGQLVIAYTLGLSFIFHGVAHTNLYDLLFYVLLMTSLFFKSGKLYPLAFIMTIYTTHNWIQLITCTCSLFFYWTQQMESTTIRWKKLSEHAIIPTYAYNDAAAAFDLYSAIQEYIVVPAFESKLIKTDIAVQLPPDTYARVASRSGLAKDYRVEVGAGVVDGDYRGNLGVLLHNHHPKNSYTVHKGDCIAQLIVEKIYYPKNLHSITTTTLDETCRNEKGFGSSGQ